MPYERENIQRLTAYTPGEQPAGAEQIIKLNTNENPYPPIEPVMQAIRTLPAEALRRYPSPAAKVFRETAAKVHGLSPEQVIATNGGDELLRLAISVFCESSCSPPSQGGAGGGSKATDAEIVHATGSPLPVPSSSSQPGAAGTGSGLPVASIQAPSRRGIGVVEPSYSLYPVLAATHATPVTRVPLSLTYELPSDLGQKMLAAGVGIVMLVNPQAPSGTLTPLPRLEKLARALMGHAVLLIDEAYVDFAERDALPLLKKESGLDNVLLLRTMSKGYSLAGLRFGYGLGHANLIAAMDKARDSYNTDALSQAAATAALANRQLAAESWKKVIAERQRMTEALRERGWFVPDSQTNFLLATPPTATRTGLSGGKEVPAAKAIYESLKARNILVRYFDHEGLRDKLRMTIGTPEENDAVLRALNAPTT